MSTTQSVEQMEKEFKEMRQKIEVAWKRKEEEARKAKEEAERKAKEEAARKAKEEAERRTAEAEWSWHEAERSAEAERQRCKAWRLPSVWSSLLPPGQGRHHWKCGG
jgi:colicin import membrane protein